MAITQLIIVAILVEAIWENLKMIWEKGKFSINRLGSLIVSIFVCVITNMNLFELVDIPINIAFVGSILTGIIVSRGANFVNDLFAKINVKGEVI